MEYKLIIAIILILIISIICIFNKLVSSKKKVEKSKSTIDVFLKKRYDLIPNLVECVKGYIKHEEKIFTSIVELRNNYNNGKTGEQELNKEYNKLIGLAESYPDLKASEQFLNLQKNISKIEDELQASRRIYINAITKYNTLIAMFPINIIALFMNYKKIDLPNYESEEIKIKF